MDCRCEVCGKPIPNGRLEALPGVTTCVEHSYERRVMDWEVEIAGSDREDLIHLAQNSNRSSNE